MLMTSAKSQDAGMITYKGVERTIMSNQTNKTSLSPFRLPDVFQQRLRRTMQNASKCWDGLITTLGARSFSAAAPKLWNDLPVELLSTENLSF